MEQENILTGYCRALDQSRMVTAELLDGKLTDVDCAYPHCPYAPNCPIGEALRELTEK